MHFAIQLFKQFVSIVCYLVALVCAKSTICGVKSGHFSMQGATGGVGPRASIDVIRLPVGLVIYLFVNLVTIC